MSEPANNLAELQQVIASPGFLSAIQKRKAELSLYEFVKQAWSVVCPFPYVDGWHIQAICEHLEAVSRGQILNLAINVPPGTTKTLICCVFWPAWEWTIRPQISFLTAAHKVSIAVKPANAARSLIASQWYQDNWRNVFSITTGQNEKHHYDNTRMGFREAAGADTDMTGDKGAILILDDPHDATSVESKAIREKTIEWWVQTFSNRVNDFITGRRVVVAQRTHHLDLFHKLKQIGGFEWLVLPEEFDSKRRCTTSLGWTDPRLLDGELLRPSRFGQDQIKQTKLESEHKYGAQHQQDPRGRDGDVFRKEGFQVVLDRLPDESLAYCRYWDRAATDGGGCYTVGVLMARSKKNYYIVDVVRGQWATDERDRIIRRTAEQDALKYKRVRHTVEQEPGSSGVDMAKAFVRLLQGFIVDTEKVTGAKEDRADPWSSACNGGIVALVRGAWNQDFIDEHLSFPGGKYVDQVDAAAGAFNRLAKGRGPGVWRLNYLGDEPVYADPPPEKKPEELVEESQESLESVAELVGQ